MHVAPAAGRRLLKNCSRWRSSKWKIVGRFSSCSLPALSTLVLSAVISVEPMVDDKFGPAFFAHPRSRRGADVAVSVTSTTAPVHELGRTRTWARPAVSPPL